MKKAQATGFMVILIGLILLAAIVVITYESVTGVNLTAIQVGNVAQNTVTEINVVVIAPRDARGLVDCPNNYDFEIKQGRVTVHKNNFYRDETLSAYYVVPNGMKLPGQTYTKCNSTNFFVIEKWMDEEGIQHLSITPTEDREYSVREVEEESDEDV